MTKEQFILQLVYRKNLLESRDTNNGAIVNKLKRRIRNLTNKLS